MSHPIDGMLFWQTGSHQPKLVEEMKARYDLIAEKLPTEYHEELMTLIRFLNEEAVTNHVFNNSEGA